MSKIYKEALNKLTVTHLKKIIRNYMSHVKIVMTGKKKDELIDHIMTHTEYKDGKISLKNTAEFAIPEWKKKAPVKKPVKKESVKKTPKYTTRQKEDMGYEGLVDDELIEEEIKSHKKAVKRETHTKKEKIYSLIDQFKDVKEWKKQSPKEKQLVCEAILYLYNEYKDLDYIKSLPKHLTDYFQNHCKEFKEVKKNSGT